MKQAKELPANFFQTAGEAQYGDGVVVMRVGDEGKKGGKDGDVGYK